jgi:uncharacterized membrane protein
VISEGRKYFHSLLEILANFEIQKTNKMKTNMGNADKIIRLIIAAIVGFLFYNGTITGTLGIILLVAAGIFVLTSLIGFCPLYTILGIKTCPTKKAE